MNTYKGGMEKMQATCKDEMTRTAVQTQIDRRLLDHNELMRQHLLKHGIKCRAKLILKGSLRGSWRFYQPNVKWYDNTKLQDKFKALGFKSYFNEDISNADGNGGAFSVFLKYHGVALHN